MKHAYRVLLLMGGTILLLGWNIKHSEPSSNVGLRYILQAEQIHRGEWREGLANGIDHPLHPLLITVAHDLVGGEGPGSWQRAALVLCFTCGVLLVIPVYLLAYDLLDEHSAWLAVVLTVANPLVPSVVLNVLSESSFLVWWTFGLWASVRFLREGRFFWLLFAAGFGGLAYLTRPEGMLLPAALAATLLTMPILRATQINWPRWRLALAFLIGGLALVAGPYVALKGGVATKPPIARVLGLAAPAGPMALEREAPLAEPQNPLESYQRAGLRSIQACCDAVTLPLIPLALLGLAFAARRPAAARATLFFAILLAASVFGLLRLYATAGYCAPRHAIVIGTIMTLAAAYAITTLLRSISVPGGWLGQAHERLHPGPAVWAMLVALFIVPRNCDQGPLNPGPYSVYHKAGEWLALNTRANEQVLDLTDWSLYFSRRPGYTFADIYDAPADPHTRWVVLRDGQVDGAKPFVPLVRELIGEREPAARLPSGAADNQVHIEIYDLRTMSARTARTDSGRASDRLRD
jgi:hypothetical protein